MGAPAPWMRRSSVMINLKIEGMTCGGCQAKVQKALEAVEGVNEVQINLAAGDARIEGNADQTQLVAAVEAVGYSATAQA